jgi:uncharacterized delta-60 repeat protein
MKLLTIIYFVVLICSLSVAQDGTIDTGFGVGGIAITPDGYASCVKIQPDGKIVIGGTDSNDTFTAARYNIDGTLDNSYGINGIVKTFLSIDGSRMHASALSPGNKIIQAGITHLYTDNQKTALVRYDSTGGRDYTFGSNGVVLLDVNIGSEYISKVIVQPDEKILVSGYTLSQGFVFRCYSNGDIDSTFGINGYIFPNPFFFITSMVIQPDGKFVITGNSISIPPTQVAVARFNSDGSPDSLFGSDGIVLTSIGTHLQIINSLALQLDGKIIFAGERLGIIGETLEDVFIRYNSNGSLDNNFGINGVVHFIPYGDFNYMTNTGLQADGKILMSGSAVVDTIGSGRSGMFLMRFDQNGNVDTTFGDNGFFITPPELRLSTGREFEIQEDNKIVLTGNSNGNFATIRVNASSISAIEELTNIESPRDFFLKQNYPNPFNPVTSIQYAISSTQFVTLKVYDLLGREIATLVDEEKPVGTYELNWNAINLPSGVYFYQLQAGEYSSVKKMILLK